MPSKCCALTQVFTELSQVAVLTNRHVSWGSARPHSQAVSPPSEVSTLPRPRPGQLLTAVPPRLWKPIPLPQVVEVTDSGDTGIHWNLALMSTWPVRWPSSRRAVFWALEESVGSAMRRVQPKNASVVSQTPRASRRRGDQLPRPLDGGGRVHGGEADTRTHRTRQSDPPTNSDGRKDVWLSHRIRSSLTRAFL